MGGVGGLKMEEIRESRERSSPSSWWMLAAGVGDSGSSDSLPVRGRGLDRKQLIHRDNCCQSGPGLD